jgi:hypothetical protein
MMMHVSSYARFLTVVTCSSLAAWGCLILLAGF